MSYGHTESIDPIFFYNDIPLPIGFTSCRQVSCHSGPVVVTCEIKKDSKSNLPLFICSSPTCSISDHQISVCVKKLLQEIKCIGKKHWSGYDFYGITRANVKKVLKNIEYDTEENLPVKCDQEKDRNKYPILKNLTNVWQRNAGPTNTLSHKCYKNSRNELIHSVVDATSFGDIKSMF